METEYLTYERRKEKELIRTKLNERNVGFVRAIP